MERMLHVLGEFRKVLKQATDVYTKKLGRSLVESRCFIEGGAYDAGGMLFTLGQLSGMLIGEVSYYGIKIREVPPSTVKKFISGHGNASKKMVMDSISTKYGIRFTNDNLADSYVLALMAHDYHGEDGEIRTHREELDTIDKMIKKDSGVKLMRPKPRYRRKKTEF